MKEGLVLYYEGYIADNPFSAYSHTYVEYGKIDSYQTWYIIIHYTISTTNITTGGDIVYVPCYNKY